MNRKPTGTAAIPALGPLCGQLAARAVNAVPFTLTDKQVWDFVMGHTEPGACCPINLPSEKSQTRRSAVRRKER